jgi:hypothetical protein
MSMALAHILVQDCIAITREVDPSSPLDRQAAPHHNHSAVESVQRHPSPSVPQQSLASDLTLGLLHQVNNVLTGIYFHVEECQEHAPSDEPAGAALEEIAEAVQNLHSLLARTIEVNLPRTEDDANYHDLEELVSSQLDLLRIVFPKTVSVDFQCASQPLHVHASEYEFRRILLSLAACLRDSMPAQNGQVAVELHLLRGTDALSSPTGNTVGVLLRCERPGWAFPASSPAFMDLCAEAAHQGWKITPEPALVLPQVDLDA